MSLTFSCLPGAALSAPAGVIEAIGVMTQKPSLDLTPWQREMEQALAQAGLPHRLLEHQHQHAQDDPDVGMRRRSKRPAEPEIADTPVCPLVPSTPPKFAAMSALPEPALPVAAHPKPAYPLPAPPVRLHAEWVAQGVMVWLGADAGATVSTPQLTQQIKHWLNGHGVQLLALVCNGKSLYSARPVNERKATHGEAQRDLQDFPHAFHSQETR